MMDHDIAQLSGQAMRCVCCFPRPVIWIATGFVSSAKFFVKILQRQFGEQPFTLIQYTSSYSYLPRSKRKRSCTAAWLVPVPTSFPSSWKVT